MRDVVLVPEHSQWWLLSPGMTLYYDRLLIHSKDYEEIMNAAGKSSYHAQVAQHLDALMRQGEEPCIEVVKDLKGLGDDYHKRGELIRDKLYALASDPQNPAISQKEIVRLTIWSGRFTRGKNLNWGPVDLRQVYRLLRSLAFKSGIAFSVVLCCRLGQNSVPNAVPDNQPKHSSELRLEKLAGRIIGIRWQPQLLSASGSRPHPTP